MDDLGMDSINQCFCDAQNGRGISINSIKVHLIDNIMLNGDRQMETIYLEDL